MWQKASHRRIFICEDIIPGILAGKAAGMKVCAVDDDCSSQQKEEKKKLSDFFIKDYFDIVSKL